MAYIKVDSGVDQDPRHHDIEAACEWVWVRLQTLAAEGHVIETPTAAAAAYLADATRRGDPDNMIFLRPMSRTFLSAKCKVDPRTFDKYVEKLNKNDLIYVYKSAELGESIGIVDFYILQPKRLRDYLNKIILKTSVQTKPLLETAYNNNSISSSSNNNKPPKRKRSSVELREIEAAVAELERYERWPRDDRFRERERTTLGELIAEYPEVDPVAVGKRFRLYLLDHEPPTDRRKWSPLSRLRSQFDLARKYKWAPRDKKSDMESVEEIFKDGE